jgi:methylated-DNA-[protein]-cysteine S-methyltransferase
VFIVKDRTAEQTIFWTYVSDDKHQLVIAATSSGLCYVGSWDRPLSEMMEWAEKIFGNCQFVQENEMMKIYSEQLEEYFKGQRISFTIPLHLEGTPFQQSVWEAMSQVPYGKTASYLDIAQTLQKPKSVRAVGTAIGRNPVLIVAPCHRIIGKNGGLTGYRGGLDMKKQLLMLENTSFVY